MTEPRFPITLELRQAPPAEVDCGLLFALDVVVDTESGADLAGAPYEIVDAEGQLLGAGTLPTLRRITPESEEYDPRHGPVDHRPFASIELVAPKAPGDHEWTLMLPALEVDGREHEPALLPFAFTTRRHRLSIVVWDAPSPVTTGTRFDVNVGMKCTGGCNLHGQPIEVIDNEGRVVASTTLSDKPAPGTEGLYFVRISLEGPEAPGRQSWSVRVPKVGRRRTHEPPKPARLDLLAVEPGSHRVQVQVADEQTGSPIGQATVRMGPYRAQTDAGGTVSLLVPKGNYDLRVMKNTYVAPNRPLAVDSDVELRLAITVPPEKDPYERYWKT
jgi:hypothetical protein